MIFEWKTAQIVCRSTDDEYILMVWPMGQTRPPSIGCDSQWFIFEIPSGTVRAQGTAPDADGAKAAAEIAWLELKEAEL